MPRSILFSIKVSFHQHPISTRDEGIAYNYEDPGVLETEADDKSSFTESPLWLAAAALIIPPACYLLVLVSNLVIQSRGKDPEWLKARKAFPEFSRDLETIDTGPSADVSEAHIRIPGAIREYLAKKLRLTAGAITYQDVAGLLTKKRGQC